MTPFWMVWREGKKKVPAYQHPTREAADAEAQRLAERHPGVVFHVLAAVHAVFTLPKTDQ